jgi:hypothetical protein
MNVLLYHILECVEAFSIMKNFIYCVWMVHMYDCIIRLYDSESKSFCVPRKLDVRVIRIVKCGVPPYNIVQIVQIKRNVVSVNELMFQQRTNILFWFWRKDGLVWSDIFSSDDSVFV